MAFEIQVHTQALVTLMENTLQQGLRTRCMPSAGEFYVDHVDVAAGKTTVSSSNGGIDFVVTMDVFVVTSGDVEAAPNGVPAGAATPLGQATITLQLSISGTILTLACTGVCLGVIGSALGSSASQVQMQIQQTIGTVGSLDVGSIVTSIGLPMPSTSSLDIIAEPMTPPVLIVPIIPGHIDPQRTVVVIRFDPSGPTPDRLQPGQEWCLFADPDTVVALVKTRLGSMLSGASSPLTDATVAAVWAPSGVTPGLQVGVAGKFDTAGFAGNAEIAMDVVIGLTHFFGVLEGVTSDLTADVSWGVTVDLGWLDEGLIGVIIPAGIKQLIVDALSSSLVDPSKFGAIALGPNEFEVLFALPALTFGAATFNYDSVVGLQDGMVLGGAVTLPGADTSTVSFDVVAFPQGFQLLVDCSKGGAAVKPALTSVTTSAAAGFQHAGAICDVHFVTPASPPIPLMPYLTTPANGTVTDSGTIAVTLPGTVALAQNPQPIQLWVQSARGVRLVDLGTPPVPQLDNQGDVTNCRVVVLDDCPWAVSPWSRIFHMYNPKWGVDPSESWAEALEQVERFETVLIEVSGIQPGSLVRFDMPIIGPGAGSTFAADGAGRALVPAVLAARSENEGARLSTADRQTLRHVAISTAVFDRAVVLDTPGALSHALSESGGAAVVTSTFEDGSTQTARIDAMRVPRLTQTSADQDAAGGVGMGVSPAPGLQATDDPAGPGGRAASAAGVPAEPGIPGLVALHPVPGFENVGIEVAELDDGSHVALVSEHGSLHAIGTVPVWPHMPPSGQAWAISSTTGDRVAVFAVSRTISKGGLGRLPHERLPASH